jgi:hypothetical protein
MLLALLRNEIEKFISKTENCNISDDSRMTYMTEKVNYIMKIETYNLSELLKNESMLSE